MNNWITSKERKNHQRAMTRTMRKVNRTIQRDNLWQGRFEVRQVRAWWVPFSDHSGEELWVQLKLIDKKTGFYFYLPPNTVNHYCFMGGSALFGHMNDFINHATTNE